MKFDPEFEPESEEEMEVIKKLAEVRAVADEIGMDDTEIAGAFQQAALLVLSGHEVERTATAGGVCPDCQTPIKDIVADEIGQDKVTLEPCGHVVGWDKIPENVLDELYFSET